MSMRVKETTLSSSNIYHYDERVQRTVMLDVERTG